MTVYAKSRVVKYDKKNVGRCVAYFGWFFFGWGFCWHVYHALCSITFGAKVAFVQRTVGVIYDVTCRRRGDEVPNAVGMQ